MANPESVFPNLIKFILNVDSIEGTMIEKYIQMAVRDKRPENYKPRQGKVNGNLERYSGSLLEDLFNRANDTIIHLGYADVFKKTDKEAATRKWWKNSNRLIQVNSTNFVNDHNLNAEEK